MTNVVPADIQLARTGIVTCRNFTKLGYHRMARGVYGRVAIAPGTEADVTRIRFLELVHATMALYGPGGATLYGPTALQVLGVELPERLQDWTHCHIQVPRGTFHPERRGVVVHRTQAPAPPSRTIAGLPMLHPVEHWTQLRGATDDELIEVGDGLVRRKRPLTSIDEMRTVLNRLAGQPGASRCRRALKWVRPRTDSLYETRTRLILVHAGLPEPAVNFGAYSREAGIEYSIDMAYGDERIGIEYDGADHVHDREQMESDATRRRQLQDEGWLLITVTRATLRRPPDLVRSVESALVLRRAAARAAW